MCEMDVILQLLRNTIEQLECRVSVSVNVNQTFLVFTYFWMARS